jgi:hypothetical protein
MPAHPEFRSCRSEFSICTAALLESMLGAIYESVPPERQANYNNRDYYVDTNYVSSGGRDRMK